MSNCILRRCLRQIYPIIRGLQKKPARRKTSPRIWLEELESRLAPSAALSSSQQILQSYGDLPISFEANAGQTAAQVQYLARGSGYALFLTSTSAVLSLENGAAVGRIANPSYAADAGTAPTSVTGVALAMNLVGANPQAAVTGQDQLPGTSNYFIGNDPSQWRTNIANYGQVAYQDVYPGIKLIYYGNQQQLEYDFVVASGADPSSIRFSVQGADSVSLDDQGNLVLATASGDVLEHAPVVYQEVSGARQAVAGQFVLLGQNEVGFQVGTYEASLPLTIDPVLSYDMNPPGSGEGLAIAVDSSGDAYVTGRVGTNFPTTTGAYQTSYGGSSDAFVTEVNAAGTAFVYSTYIGGNGSDQGTGIAVDGSGDAYIAGWTRSTNFPTTADAYQTVFAGGPDNVFITKLNAAGTGLIYSTFVASSDNDVIAQSIAIDGSGNAYVTGSILSGNFPTTAGAFQTSGVPSDAFVLKLNPTGTALVYSTCLGGSTGAIGYGIVVDSTGNAYVTGATDSFDFPTTAGCYQSSDASANGGSNVFVTKLNATGSGLIYSTYLGGSNYDIGLGITVDSTGDAYVTGYADSTDFPTTIGAFQTNFGKSTGYSDAFLTKLNSGGTALIYSTYLGGTRNDIGYAIAVDGLGNAYVVGGTTSFNFPITPDAYDPSDTSGGFLTKLNSTGSALVYSTYHPGIYDNHRAPGAAAY